MLENSQKFAHMSDLAKTTKMHTYPPLGDATAEKMCFGPITPDVHRTFKNHISSYSLDSTESPDIGHAHLKKKVQKMYIS